ncbi:ABC transporter permease subunit [Idiomarina seosinensis]|uniref:ABC transporter permease n=1 Tax=Idiomarina seosinensis TaxID=281739 RepID=A0A432ZGR2_9GAMM|nr:ABC transporter permease subunit [Idiomarina seosinensis]RUO77010.1 ABC transporter permease [Idiomarina seosinensis]
MVRAFSVIAQLLLVALPLLLVMPSLFQFSGGSIQPWLEPLFSSLLLTITTTLLAAYLALQAAQYSLVRFSRLTAILSLPHVAFAVGLMFLLSPSGYLVRIIEAVTGWLPSPPVGWPLPEKSMVTLTLVLVAKEVPFLLLMIAAQLRQLPYQRWLLQAQSLGWSRSRSWWLIVVPALLPRLKFPLAAIAIYTVSVVDIPLLVGPNTPGVLAMVIFEQQYQFNQAGSIMVGVGLLIAAGVLLLAFNAASIRMFLRFSQRQRRVKTKSPRFGWTAGISVRSVLVVVSWLVLALLLLHSIAGGWFYPDLVPNNWQWQRWVKEWPYIQPLLWTSFWLAVVSALLGLIAAVAVLEWQRQRQQRQLKVWPLLMLLIPQLVLVLGWQQSFGQGSQGPALVWSHTVFCFPYAYLVLHGAWVNYDERWLYQAQSLGYSYWQSWWRILLPMLKAPLLMAFAVAFSVSIAQYLPTQWLAGGTLPTLTTETVSIAAGGDWRLASVYALMQAALPMLVLLGLIFFVDDIRLTDAAD